MPLFSLGERRPALLGNHHYVAHDATLVGDITLHNNVNVFQSEHESILIPYIPEKKANVWELGFRKHLGHLILLQFIARVHYDSLHLRVLQQAVYALMAKGTGSSGDENRVGGKHVEK